jgi:ankyrin repeat protein
VHCIARYTTCLTDIANHRALFLCVCRLAMCSLHRAPRIPPSPQTVNTEGETPLHVCARYGHTACLAVLLAAHAPLGGAARRRLNFTARDYRDGNTALHLSVQYQHEELMVTLVNLVPELVHIRQVR